MVFRFRSEVDVSLLTSEENQSLNPKNVLKLNAAVAKRLTEPKSGINLKYDSWRQQFTFLLKLNWITREEPALVFAFQNCTHPLQEFYPVYQIYVNGEWKLLIGVTKENCSQHLGGYYYAPTYLNLQVLKGKPYVMILSLKVHKTYSISENLL